MSEPTWNVLWAHCPRDPVTGFADRAAAEKYVVESYERGHHVSFSDATRGGEIADAKYDGLPVAVLYRSDVEL